MKRLPSTLLYLVAAWCIGIGAAGATLVLLIRRLDEFPVLIWPVAVLSVGVIGAQIFGGGTLGAPPALLIRAGRILQALEALSDHTRAAA